MQFLKPEFLYALWALIIPILVHLFHLRRFQKQSFSNVAFLKQIKLQTRRSSTLKKWLVLLIRLFAMAFIVLAFAKPFVSNSTKNSLAPEIVIYLDNSFSMQAKNEKGPLLSGAIQDILNQEFVSNEISLFTNNNTYKKLNTENLRQELLEIQYTHRQLDFQSIIAKSNLLFSDRQSQKKYLVIISDLQHLNPEDLNQITDLPMEIILVQKSALSNQNTYIDSIEISSEIEHNNLLVHGSVSNNDQDSITISLYDKNKLIGKSILTQSNNYKTSFSVPNSNALLGKLVIDDIGPDFDNNFFFNIPKQNKIKVLAIGYSQSNYLNRIFTEDEFIFSFSTQDQLNYNNIQKQNLIILNELNSLSNTLGNSLKTFLTNGGTVLFIPSSIGSLKSYNDLLGFRNLNLTSKYNDTRKIIKINFDHPLFDQSFEQEVSNFKYPKVASFYKIKTSLKPLLEFEDGNPFLVEKNRFFMFSAPLNTTNSNFTNSPLIVPTLYGIGKSCYKAPKLYYRIGEYNEINLDYELKNDAVLSLSKGEDNFIPLQSMQNSKLKLNFEDLPEKAGHYALKSKTDTIQHVSFNYKSKESEIGTYNSKNLTQKESMKSIESAFESIKSEVNIKELWKWFVTFALIFLILEMIILKFFR